MIYVCNLLDMPRCVDELRPSHLISLVAPDEMPETPSGVRASCHLRIACHDIVEPMAEHILPDIEHVRILIAFAERWNRDSPMLIHCVAGVSRSMAAALVVSTLQAGGCEHELAQGLRARAPHANPNWRIIALADELLGRGGRLNDAVKGMGPAQTIESGVLVELPQIDVSK